MSVMITTFKNQPSTTTEKEVGLTNSFVNKRKIIVHLTYTENDNLSIRVHSNTKQDWFIFSMNSQEN